MARPARKQPFLKRGAPVNPVLAAVIILVVVVIAAYLIFFRGTPKGKGPKALPTLPALPQGAPTTGPFPPEALR